MNDEILFREVQKFNQWWLWSIVIGANLVLLVIIVVLLVKQPFGDKPSVKLLLLLAAGVSIVPTVLFLNFRLETQVKQDGVYARFFPLHLSWQKYGWNTIAESYVRQYDPLGEYGGWGIRWNGSGKAFNVAGNKGLQLVFADNKKLLIGTNKPEELAETLKRIDQIKPPQQSATNK